MIFPSARPSPPHHFSRFFLAVHDASPANPVFSHSCGLFFSLCTLFDARLVCFQYLADSFCKTPGGGGTSATSPRLSIIISLFLSPLCFHGLTNCFSLKSFI